MATGEPLRGCCVLAVVASSYCRRFRCFNGRDGYVPGTAMVLTQYAFF